MRKLTAGQKRCLEQIAQVAPEAVEAARANMPQIIAGDLNIYSTQPLLVQALRWADTAEGLEYWSNICDSIYAILSVDIDFGLGEEIISIDGSSWLKGFYVNAWSKDTSGYLRTAMITTNWVKGKGPNKYIFVRGNIAEKLSEIGASAYVSDCNWTTFLLKRDYRFQWVDFGVEDGTRLSAMPQNWREHRAPTVEERKEKGVFIKPARLLRALLDKDDVQKETQELCSWLVGRASLVDEIKISHKPSRIYTMPIVAKGSLGSSCMQGKPAHYFELYDKLRRCSIAYIKRDGKLLGRALLWKGVSLWEKPGKIDLMDRIYSTNVYVEEAFKKWAMQNGFFYKENQSYRDKRWIATEDGPQTLFLRFPCRWLKKLSTVPFMDTFSYWHKGELRNFWSKGDIILEGQHDMF